MSDTWWMPLTKSLFLKQLLVDAESRWWHRKVATIVHLFHIEYVWYIFASWLLQFDCLESAHGTCKHNDKWCSTSMLLYVHGHERRGHKTRSWSVTYSLISNPFPTSQLIKSLNQRPSILPPKSWRLVSNRIYEKLIIFNIHKSSSITSFVCWENH